MQTQIKLGEIVVNVMQKDIKNVHLSVYPPTGRVCIAAPAHLSLDTIRVFAISKLPWIRSQQKKLQAQERETPREYLSRESHFLWGHRYLMKIAHHNKKPQVILSKKRITLMVRPGHTTEKCAEVMHEWHKSLLHEVLPRLIQKWEKRLNVRVSNYFLQRMKTKWGSCNPTLGNIRINTELVKKPRKLLEYVIVHEMAHLIERTHNDRFISILDQHYSGWREARAELNSLPLAAEVWKK